MKVEYPKVEFIIPPLSCCTDNAAMIAVAGHYKYLAGDFCGIDVPIYSNTRL